MLTSKLNSAVSDGYYFRRRCLSYQSFATLDTLLATLYTVQQEPTISTSQIVSPLYSTLVQADPLTRYRWVPDLAEKWNISSDRLTYTSNIRQDVRFRDGALFTTEDAVFNLQRITNPPKGVMSNIVFLLKQL